MRRRTNEAFTVHGRTDHRNIKGAGGRREDGRSLPQARHLGCNLYKYKAKYGQMDVSEARKLKAFEDENAKLKRLLAEAMLDNAILNDVASKKW